MEKEVTAVDLRAEQEHTLRSSRRRYGWLVRPLFLFININLLYCVA